MPKTQDRLFLFADDFHVADACAHQFYADAIARLQTLEPTVAVPESPSSGKRKLMVPYKTLSFVARANALTSKANMIIDLLELETRINAKCDPSSCAIFEPDEYPGLVWLDINEDSMQLEPADVSGGPQSVADMPCEMKTLVFPSGAIIVHGISMDKMEEYLKRKLPLIQKCMVEAPPAVVSILQSAAATAAAANNI